MATREHILSWYRAGLKAVEPEPVTRSALNDLEIGDGKLVMLSIGKAAVAMAKAANDVLGTRVTSGLIVTKSGQYTEEVDGFIGIEAAHPIPNEASLSAAERALDAVSNLGDSDTVIALISGGGSSLLECPVDGVSLMDLQITTELLMYAGAGIYDLNTVRKSLSAIKGGGLRRAIGEARCITLMLSDVLGNDFGVIASGPTIVEPIDRLRAWQVLGEFRLHERVPETVRLHLTSDAPSENGIDTSRDITRVVADNNIFVDAIEAAAQADGLTTARHWHHWSDDAQELAHQIVADCRVAEPGVNVLIGGGEATSIVHGSGKGGRNTETALATAMLMKPEDDWLIASLSSDGDDGNSGAAGAIVDAATVDNPETAKEALAESDSAGYLSSRNALVTPGPTGTNVNDVYIAVRGATQ